MSLTFQDKLKLAEIYSKSTFIPEIYRNNVSNVFIILEFAEKRNIDPMQVMQSTFLTHNKFTLTTAFAISLANQSGLLDSGIRYDVKGEGDDLQVTASTILKTKEEISYTVTMKMAKAENWIKNPKYKSLPDLMLKYRAAIFLIRTHIPEVLNGYYTKEEMEDVESSKIKNIQTIKTIHVLQEEENISLLTPLQTLIQEYQIDEKTQKAWCKKANVDDISQLNNEIVQKLIVHYNAKQNITNTTLEQTTLNEEQIVN